ARREATGRRRGTRHERGDPAGPALLGGRQPGRRPHRQHAGQYLLRLDVPRRLDPRVRRARLGLPDLDGHGRGGQAPAPDVGLVPDVAALRDQSTGIKKKIYAVISLGWEGSDSQWRHYRRAYGLLAALATPLVLSVHSVVSFDFAMALVPGWHSTLFAPFFVDGAIFSGFAMVLLLMLPMRYLFNWYAYIGDKHLDAMAKLILVTSLVLTYFYVCEAFTSWYSGEGYERASLFYRATRQYAWAFWLQYFCNCLPPTLS